MTFSWTIARAVAIQPQANLAHGKMTFRQTPIWIHLLGAAAASALAAYWILQLLTPASAVVPPAGPALTVREPDPRLAARLFGDLNSGPVAVARNVQVNGVYVAGQDSSAVVVVDGKASRAVLLGQDVAAGLRLVDVRVDGITLEADGARTQYAVPPLSVARASATAPMFRRDGNVLTAPTQEAAVGNRPTPAPPQMSGRFSGSIGPAPTSGMLVPPQRGPNEEPGGRPGQPGVPGGSNPGSAPGNPSGG
jgi:hypothetical protein